eukprot:scaffold79891_cov32-Tisochrysis_lutea.AAC.4
MATRYHACDRASCPPRMARPCRLNLSMRCAHRKCAVPSLRGSLRRPRWGGGQGFRREYEKGTSCGHLGQRAILGVRLETVLNEATVVNGVDEC